MLKRLLLVLGVAALTLGWAEVQGGITPQGQPYVEIWTDRGEGGIYRAGEAIEVYMRPADDCYVIVYEIDTDGYLNLLYPYDGLGDGYVMEGQVYRLGGGPWRRYYVTGPSGIEYIHVLASFRPFRELYWHGCAGYDDYAYDVSWRGFGDYWGCALPPRIYGDPYIAMESIDEFICFDALEAGLVWADFTCFYVDERVQYPRYLCYDCHGFDPCIRPYVHVCAGFSITFVACDPCYRPCTWWWWCTPKRVYCGPRYVCSCKKPCNDYPSQYKWKSRCESSGSISQYAGYWDERVRTKSRSVTKDKPKVVARRQGEDLNLYTRGEPQSRSNVAPRVERAPERQEAKVRQIPVGIDKEKSREPAREEASGSGGQAARVETAKDRSRGSEGSKVADRSVRSKVQKTQSTTTRKIAPTVRTTDKGKSPSTRRRLSR